MYKLLTIFTPTYNRAHTLLKLYNSLCMQTNLGFKWLIIDDGSTDNTEQLVQRFMNEKKIDIAYHKQVNVGKALSHNKGVALTTTELFVCVDSDDALVPNAVEYIASKWETIKSTDCVGMLAYKVSFSGKMMTHCDKNIHFSTLRNAYQSRKLRGETMLVYRTDIIKQYSFPHYEGEKFVTEAYLYDLIDQVGELYFLHEALYLSDYLEDGYTMNIHKIKKNNPNGHLAYIQQRIKLNESYWGICKDTIRYIAIAKCVYKPKEIISKAIFPHIAFMLYPIGIYFYRKLYK